MESEKLCLYCRRGSRAARVKMLMDQMGLSYELREIDGLEQKSDDYLAINPFGTVPTLVHGDRVILESAAQMMYLADLVPEKGFAPQLGTLERGTYYEWFVLSVATLEPIGSRAFSNPDDNDAIAAMMMVMDVIEDRLTMPFAMGENFYSFDILLHWQLNMLLNSGIGFQDKEKTEAYFQGLSRRLDWQSY